VVEFLPSKQAVAGSSPVSRSTKVDDYLPRLRGKAGVKLKATICLGKNTKRKWADRNEW
jgi:hypothetical protein